MRKLWNEITTFFSDLKEFFQVYWWYLQKKITHAWHSFEQTKGYLVSFLIVKRGRYSRSFLNTSFFLLTVSGVMVSPIIASSYPGVNQEELAEFESPQAIATSLDQSQIGASTQISIKPRDRVSTYTVQKGDTLTTIADTFGVSEDSIKWASDLKSDKLAIGQELKIPPVDGVVHEVQEGDTVYSIADRYKTSPQKIVDFPFNDFVDLDTFSLRVGQTLVIPDGVPVQSPAIARSAPVPATAIVPGAGGVYIWPAQGQISQYPVWYHMALDIANKTSPLILSSRAGKVAYSGCLKFGYGCHIIVDHGDGYQTLYAHMQRLDVNVGASVGQGTVIGQMGSTGRSTGTHLHFEVRRNGVNINPLPFRQ